VRFKNIQNFENEGSTSAYVHQIPSQTNGCSFWWSAYAVAFLYELGQIID
jgi:hypothetical protein